MVYVWVTIPDTLPPVRALRHQIAMRIGDSQRPVSTDAAPLTLTDGARVIAPPLRGGGWLAANGPSNTSGHRRSVVPVDGRARIPQRFGIDWLQISRTAAAMRAIRKTTRTIAAMARRRSRSPTASFPKSKTASRKTFPVPRPARCPSPSTPPAATTSSSIFADGIYAFYAHLQPGSLKVKVGDKVRRGQVLGLIGNSGNSTEPHLHFI